MKRWMSMLLVPALCLAAGCGQAPNDKLSEAEKAVMNAKLAGAQAYLPEDYAKLEGMLTNAKTELADQGGKFALFRDYGKAEQLLVAVKTETSKLIEETAKKKAATKDLALTAHQAAKDAVKAAQALVAKAPVGKDRAAVEAIKNEAKVLKASLNEVQMAMDMEDYLTAQAKAKAVQEKSLALTAEVQSALAKVGGAGTKSPKKKK